MASTAAPYGLIPTKNISGSDYSQQVIVDGITSGYLTTLYSYQLVKFAASNASGTTTGAAGTLAAAAAGEASVGVFLGVEYTAADNTRVTTNTWTGGTTYITGTCKVTFTRDPFIQYQVQGSGSITKARVGSMADIGSATAHNGNYSASTLDVGTFAALGASAQLQILEIVPSANNEPGDAFTDVYVRINEHQFAASTVSI